MPSIFDLAGPQFANPSMHASVDALDPAAPQDYRELAVVLLTYWRRHDQRVIGLGGGQGAGKSTLATLVEAAAVMQNERVITLGLDDFYLTQMDRAQLAEERHELFHTRGPPGTHDIAKLLQILDDLQHERPTEVPKFDKGLDERVGNVRLHPPYDRIVVEGWCVGARPQEGRALEQPLNKLECQRDPERVWRNAINAQLADDYAQLRAKLNCLVYIQVPDMTSVRQWRLQQEQERPPSQRKDADWVEEFVQYYQRLTQWMQQDVPVQADVVVELDANHRVTRLTLR